MTHASKPRRSVLSRSSGTTTRRAGATWHKRWLVQLLPDLLLLCTILIGLIFLFNRWWSIPIALRPAGLLGQAVDAFAARGYLPMFGVLLLLPTSLGAVHRLRWRINHVRLLWKSTCPKCGSADLQRTPRKPIERRIANMGIPVRRYICVDCHWRGPRIEGTLVHD